MSIKRMAAVCVAALALAAPAVTPARAQDAEWRVVPPENLLVVQTSKGRVLVELDPRLAPQHIERIRTLAGRGFYDGHRFHRVLTGFMAQTGDPTGTGMGGSDLPDMQGEFTFRRGPADGFVGIADGRPGLRGLVGSMPIQTQPDAQMAITADSRVGAQPMFCRGVMGMARSNSPNSANSQFFFMTGENPSLNGGYTAWGRVVDGMAVIDSLKAGVAQTDGRVQDPDVMVSARIASTLPERGRPSVRVMRTSAPAFAAAVEAVRAERGPRFSVCDAQPPVQVTG